MLTARCPNNAQHNRFITVAHVAQDWEVDCHGNFQKVGETTETVAGPMAGNTWSCAICGVEATVKETND